MWRIKEWNMKLYFNWPFLASNPGGNMSLLSALELKWEWGVGGWTNWILSCFFVSCWSWTGWDRKVLSDSEVPGEPHATCTHPGGDAAPVPSRARLLENSLGALWGVWIWTLSMSWIYGGTHISTRVDRAKLFTVVNDLEGLLLTCPLVTGSFSCGVTNSAVLSHLALASVHMWSLWSEIRPNQKQVDIFSLDRYHPLAVWKTGYCDQPCLKWPLDRDCG